MLSLILLTGDTKLAQQIELWVRQFLGERLRVEAFKSVADYKAMLEATNEALRAASGAPVMTEKENAPKEIRLFVIDAELIQNQKPSLWVAELQRLTTELGRRHLIDGAPAKTIVMGFEGGTHRPEAFQHESIDDLILKPVDRSLFLQKVEYLISDDPKITPTFLFRAKATQIVEVGRDVVIDEISEFAVSIRSPGPVPEGSFAAIHSDVFGPKSSRRLIGRVYESVRHPVREGEYVVRFSFFGISTEQLSTVRRFIKQNQTTVRTKTWGPPGVPGSASAATAAAAAADAKPGLSKELRDKMALLKMRKFAVVDLNPETLAEAKSALESGFKGIQVRVFPSYMRLLYDLRKLLPDAKAARAVTPPAAQPAGSSGPAFPTGKRLVFVVRGGKTQSVARLEPALKKTDLVLGRPATDWTERPDLFANSIEKEDREIFEEFIPLLEAGTSGRSHFRMIDAGGRTVYLEATGSLEKAAVVQGDGSSLMRLDLQEMDAESWSKAVLAHVGGTPTAKDPSQFRFEAILIDGAFLRPDPAAWYEGLVEMLRATKVLGPDDVPPKIFVLSDPKAKVRLEEFRIKGISDLSFKPIDRRSIMQKYQAFFPGLTPLREPESPPFVPCEIAAKMGKEVTMEEVSEFGLTIQHPTAFREKSFMRFYSHLFGEDGEWVAGKCHFCEKVSDTEAMKCRFFFFGPQEELTQRIRRWIREDYVAKKDGNSKG